MSKRSFKLPFRVEALYTNDEGTITVRLEGCDEQGLWYGSEDGTPVTGLDTENMEALTPMDEWLELVSAWVLFKNRNKSD